MEDHYFGSIKERISCFMKELNEELWKLGISAKTSIMKWLQLSLKLLDL
jgi:glutamine synthetase type III